MLLHASPVCAVARVSRWYIFVSTDTRCISHNSAQICARAGLYRLVRNFPPPRRRNWHRVVRIARYGVEVLVWVGDRAMQPLWGCMQQRHGPRISGQRAAMRHKPAWPRAIRAQVFAQAVDDWHERL